VAHLSFSKADNGGVVKYSWPGTEKVIIVH
jgi:hypothetical protein